MTSSQPKKSFARIESEDDIGAAVETIMNDLFPGSFDVWKAKMLASREHISETPEEGSPPR